MAHFMAAIFFQKNGHLLLLFFHRKASQGKAYSVGLFLLYSDM